MLKLPDKIIVKYESELKSRYIPQNQYVYYKKWLRFYLDFCDKYGHSSLSVKTLELFLEKLVKKNQSEMQRNQAKNAVFIYFNASDFVFLPNLK